MRAGSPSRHAATTAAREEWALGRGDTSTTTDAGSGGIAQWSFPRGDTVALTFIPRVLRLPAYVRGTLFRERVSHSRHRAGHLASAQGIPFRVLTVGRASDIDRPKTVAGW